MSCYPQNWVIYTTINPHCFIYLTLCRYLPQKLKFHWFLMRRLTAGAWSRQLTRASNVSPIFGSNTWPCRDTKTDRFFFRVRPKPYAKTYAVRKRTILTLLIVDLWSFRESVQLGLWLRGLKMSHTHIFNLRWVARQYSAPSRESSTLSHLWECNINGGDEGGSSTCMKFTPREYSFHSLKTSFSVQFPICCIFVYCYFTLIICNINEKVYMPK